VADEGIKAGEAYVAVSLRLVPGAFQKLATDNNALASKAGDTLGDSIGKAIAKKIATSVKDGITAGGVGVGTQGTKQGEDFGGKFAEVVKTRIAAALKSLPKAEIGIATTEAEQKLKDLRSQLSTLSSRRIGVDLSVDEALAEVARIRADLDRLGRDSADISVRVDTRSAAVELDKLKADLNRLSGDAGKAGAKAGDEFGGKFGETVRTKIAAALKALPPADISLGTADADAKLRDLRTRLEELSGKRVGIDISGEDALAEIRDIKLKLDELGAKSPNIQVKTDAAAASAQLAAVQAQVNQLNGKNANVSVKTNADQEAQKVLTLANAIILLGPAAIPSAAAAVGAILGIGAAATSVFAAIGVGKLAFQGVGGALTAIDNAQQGAAKSGATLAQQQNQLASGADAVKSAEASLANTRASAASSVRSANQQLGSSEQSLADAERAELRIQQDLTVAREDAKRSIEDLNLQVADGAIQQRQAALDVQKARDALTAANAAGSTTSAEQRQQAQITYDQAVQQVTDLSIRQQRATQDRDAANKAGVEGSKQVKAAQENLLQANEKVGNAEQAVTNARIAAADASRQAAFSIAQAQQSVISSQRAMGQALVSTSVTGGAAVDALQVALAKLSPEGQKFAYFLYGLKPQLDQLKQSAQAGLFPGLQSGITTLLPYFGQLDRFVGNVATELGHLGSEAAHTFTDPFWRQFFSFIADQAVPNLELMYRSIVNVAEGGARIVQAFGPVEQQVGQIILGLTQKFLNFSQGLDHNQGFQNFIRYVETETPHVIATIEALGAAGLHIIQAYAPIGSIVVSEIRLLANVINAIPVPVITALAFAFTAYKTGALLATIAQQGLNSSLITGIGRMVTYGTATSAAGVTTTAFQRATQGAAGFLGGGVFGLALGGAVLAISYFAGEAQKAKQRTDDLKASLTQFADAYKDGVTPAANANAAALVANNSGLKGLLDVTNKAGLSTQTLVQGLNGNADARRKVVQAINDQQQAELLAASEARNGSDADNVASKAHRDRANALGVLHDAFISNTASGAQALDIQKHLDAEQHNAVFQLKAIQSAYTAANASADTYGAAIDAVGNLEADATVKGLAYAQLAAKIADSNLSAADKASLFGKELDTIGQSATANGPVFDALAVTFNSIARATLNAHDKVNLLNQALKDMYQPSIDLNEANEQLVRTQADFKTQISQSSDGFDLNTKASGANKSAILQNRDALEAALQAARDKYVQDLANNIGETDARKTHDATVKSILDGIPTRQRDTQAVKDLVTEYGDVPKHVNTDVTTPGLADAIDQLAKAHAVQAAIGPPVQDAAWIQNEYQYLIAKLSGAPSQALFHAAGGPINGPGTGTSDSIPAMLSNDEHVWTAAEVHAAGGHGSVEALRKAALDRQLPHFATGGAVWPITYEMGDLDRRALATLSGLQAQYAAASRPSSGATTGDPGVAQTIYQVAQGLKADHRALLSAFETALVESGMRNLKVATDHDSLGVFQQRPSQGWGSPAQVTDVAYAARAYLTRAISNESKLPTATAGQLAQSVQRSAFPARYDQRQAAAEAIIAAVSGGAGAAVGNAISGAAGTNFHFPPWPASPAAQRGDSGVWREIVKLVNSTGPVSGTFGNAYRPGDPLWHGSGRALDWMGFNQDALATFLTGQNPLELIHRTNKRDYAYTRGVNKGSFNNTLMEQHRNHVHIAKAAGGPVLAEQLGIPHKVFDTGGLLMPGLTLADNRTGAPELIQAPAQSGNGGPTNFNVILEASDPAVRQLMSLIDVRVEAGHDRVAAAVGSGVRDY
jgi:hypothetical protein